MKMKLVNFGRIDIEGQSYEHDVVVEKGRVRKRSKKVSKAYRDRYGHTPLSAQEDIPWHGKTLYIGTGAYGSLPVMPEVYALAIAPAAIVEGFAVFVFVFALIIGADLPTV